MLSEKDWAKLGLAPADRIYLLMDRSLWPDHLHGGHWLAETKTVHDLRYGRSVTPQRYLYELVRGVLPQDRCVRVFCKVRNCCNPWHAHAHSATRGNRRKQGSQVISPDLVDLAKFLMEEFGHDDTLGTITQLAHAAADASGVPTSPDQVYEALKAVYPSKLPQYFDDRECKS